MNDVLETRVIRLVSQLTEAVLESRPRDIASFLAQDMVIRRDYSEEDTTMTSLDSTLTTPRKCNPTKDTSISNVMHTKLVGHVDAVTQCKFYNDYVFTSSLDKTVRIWKGDVSQAHQKRECIAVLDCESPIGDMILVKVKNKASRVMAFAGCKDGKVNIWRIQFVSNDKRKLPINGRRKSVITDGGTEIKYKRITIIHCNVPNPIATMVVSDCQSFMATGCCFEMSQITIWRSKVKAVRGTLKTWNMTDILSYTSKPRDPSAGPPDFTHMALKTAKQLMISAPTTTYCHDTQYQKTSSNHKLSLEDTEEQREYGIRSLAYSSNSKFILVGLGHPLNMGAYDERLLVVCEAISLNNLWTSRFDCYQINNILIQSKDDNDDNVYISTQRTMMKYRMTSNGEHGVKMTRLWNNELTSDHYGGDFKAGVVVSGVVCDDRNSKVIISNADNGDRLSEFPIKHDVTIRMSISPCGRYLASVGRKASLWKVDAILNDSEC